MAKVSKKLAIAIFAVSFVLLLAAFYLNSAMTLRQDKIVTKLRVNDRASFDLSDKTVMNFGKIIPGSSSDRELNVNNSYDFSVKIEIESEGNITRFLHFQNPVKLDSGKSTSVRVSAIIPVNESYEDYSGILTVTIKRDIFG